MSKKVPDARNYPEICALTPKMRKKMAKLQIVNGHADTGETT
jgi:hypothetical protein